MATAAKARQKENKANNIASSSDDEINTMKVGDIFHNPLEEKKKGKKDKEIATAKANVKTVKEKDSNAKSAKDWTDEKVPSLLICWKQILVYGMYIILITPSVT